MPDSIVGLHRALAAGIAALRLYLAASDAKSRGVVVWRELTEAVHTIVSAVEAFLSARGSRVQLTANFRMRMLGALQHVTSAHERSHAMSKTVISPQVAEALHAALQTVINAINAPDAQRPVKPRKPRYELPPLPQKPDSMTTAQWRAHTKAEAARMIASARSGNGRGGPWKNYAEADWTREQAALEERLFTGQR